MSKDGGGGYIPPGFTPLMTNINLSDNVIEFDPSVNYDNIVLDDRVNKDLIINSNGRKLIELYQVTGVSIVNGRIGKDSIIGEYTS